MGSVTIQANETSTNPTLKHSTVFRIFFSRLSFFSVRIPILRPQDIDGDDMKKYRKKKLNFNQSLHMTGIDIAILELELEAELLVALLSAIHHSNTYRNNCSFAVGLTMIFAFSLFLSVVE